MMLKQIVDDEVIIKIREGSIDDYWYLYNKFKSGAIKIAHAAVPNIIWMIPQSDLDLIYSQAFIRAIDKFRLGKCKFSSYLINVYRFDIISYIRENYPSQDDTQVLYSLDYKIREQEGCVLSDVVGDNSSVHKIYSNLEFAEFLKNYDAVEKYLPPSIEKVLQLLYLGFNVREISKKINVSYSKVVRDLKVFRAYINEQYKGSFDSVKFANGYIGRKKYNKFAHRRKKIS